MNRTTLTAWMAAGALVASAMALGAPAAVAQVSGDLNWQGQLTNAQGAPITTATTVVFRLYNAATGGTAVWTETQTVTPNGNGVFSIRLGSVTTFASAGITFSQPQFLGLTVGADAEMTPRFQVNSSPSAIRARHVGSIDGSSLNTTVTDAALNTLTAGSSSNADSLHVHTLAAMQGLLLDAQLSTNVPLRNQANTFSATQTFSAAPNFSNASGAPFSVTSTGLVGNLNADQLDGLDSLAFAQTGVAQTVTGAWTFSGTATFATATFGGTATFNVAPSFAAAAGAPFSVSSGTLVANLNADRLDGIDSLAFAQRALNESISGNWTFTGTHDVATAANWRLAGTAFTGTMAELNSLRGGGSTNLHTHFGTTWSGTDNTNPGLALSNAGSTPALRATSTGTGHGAETITSDPTRFGLVARNLDTAASTGNPTALQGIASNALGRGVHGTSATGAGTGVFGDASAVGGVGIHARGTGAATALHIDGSWQISGTGVNATAANLNTLVGGAASSADALHSHSNLGGFSASQYLRSDTSDSFTSGTLTFASGTSVVLPSGANSISGGGSGSGLSADDLDGINETAFAQLAQSETVTGAWTFNGAAAFPVSPTFSAGAGQPFSVGTNNTLVSNLNADLFDGLNSTAFGQLGQAQTVAGTWTFTGAAGFTGGATFNTASFTGAGVPFTVAGAGLVTNLNADRLDGLDSLAFGQRAANETISGNWGFTGTSTFSNAAFATASFTAAAGAPFSVASTGLVANLNADQLDGLNSTAFGQLGSAQSVTGVWTFSGAAAFPAAPSFTAAGAPFSVASSSLVANLNADQLDGLDSTAFPRASVNETITGNWTFSSAATFSAAPGFTSGGAAPFTTTNSGVVTNLNADLLDGVSEAAFAQLGQAESVSGAWAFSGGPTFSAAPGFTAASGQPFTVTSNTTVANLSADLLDGLNESDFGRLAQTETVTANWTFSANPVFSGTPNFTGTPTFANAAFTTAAFNAGSGAPFTVAATATGVVTNLNADQLDGLSSAAFGQLGSAQSVTGAWSFSGAAAFPTAPSFTAAAGAPFSVGTNTTLVTNLNADRLDGLDSTAFPRASVNETITGNWTFSSAATFSAAPSFTAAAGAPFSVGTNTNLVTNLNADRLNGVGEPAFGQLAQNESVSGAWSFTGGPSFTTAPSFTAAAGQPFTVASSTTVANLSADMLDGVDESAFGRLAQTETVTGSWTFGGGATLPASTTLTLSNASLALPTGLSSISGAGAGSGLNADQLDGLDSTVFARANAATSVTGLWDFQTAPSFTSSGAAPFTTTNAGLVTNLNADLLDGISEAAFAQLGQAESVTGAWSFGAATNIATASNWQLGGVGFAGSMANLNELRAGGTTNLHHHFTQTWTGASTSAGLVVSNTNATGAAGAHGLHALTADPLASGLLAQNTDTASAVGNPTALRALASHATLGIGVHGLTATSSSNGVGVLGEVSASATGGIGVHAKAPVGATALRIDGSWQIGTANVNASVGAAALNTLTGGASSDASLLHTHAAAPHTHAQYLQKNASDTWGDSVGLGTLVLGDSTAGADTISIAAGNLFDVAGAATVAATGSLSTNPASSVTFNNTPTFTNGASFITAGSLSVANGLNATFGGNVTLGNGSGTDTIAVDTGAGTPDLVVAEGGVSRTDASNTTFDFSNPGTGDLNVRVDGTLSVSALTYTFSAPGVDKPAVTATSFAFSNSDATAGSVLDVSTDGRFSFANGTGSAFTLSGTPTAARTFTLPDLDGTAAVINVGQTWSARPAFNGGTTGTDSPFTVDSTDVVSNLNADLLDGLTSTAFGQLGQGQTVTGTWTFNTTAGSVPFNVDVTDSGIVTNLNADLLDNLQGADLLRSNIAATWAVAGSGGTFTMGDSDDTFTVAAATLNINSTSIVLPTSGFSGAGSGSNLDADLLDGQSEAFYLDVSNMNAGTLAIARGGTNSGTALNDNRIMMSSSGAIVEAGALTNGQLLIGSTGGAPVGAGLAGTTNQVNVATGAGSITLSLPQDIHTAATPSFSTLTSTVGIGTAPFTVTSTTLVTNLNADFLDGQTEAFFRDVSNMNAGTLAIVRGGTNSGTALNDNRIMMSSSGAIVEAGALTNGQLLIGSTGGAPVGAGLAGTTNQVNVATGAGSITLSLPQDIHTAATPSFSTLTSTVGIGTAPFTVTSTTLVTNLNTDRLDGNDGAFYQDLSNMNAGTLAIVRGGTNSGTALNDNRIMMSSSGAIVEAGALTNGQLLIGSTGGAPVGAGLAGTTNQVNVATGAGSITLSLPQDIHTAATPSFSTLTSTVGIGTAPFTVTSTTLVTNLNTDRLDGNDGAFYQDLSNMNAGTLAIVRGGTNSGTALNDNRIMMSSSGAIVEAGALTNGQLLIGSTGGAPVGAGLAGTTNQVNVATGAGSITLSLPQDIHTAATPSFSTLTSTVGIGTAPFTVTSTTLVTNLNADFLDGQTEAFFRDVSNMNAGTLAIVRGGTNSGTALNDNRIMMSSSGAIVEAGALTNGQLLIGSTGGAPVGAGLAGTTNQVNVATGAGSITLSLPQDIHTAATPSFSTLTSTVGIGTAPFTVTSTTLVTNLNADLLDGQSEAFYRDVSNMNAGTLAIVRGGTNSGTALNDNRIMMSSSGAIVEAGALTNGQLLIGSTGGAPVGAGLAGTTNQVNVATGAGSITLSLPQDIHTAATPSFLRLSSTQTTGTAPFTVTSTTLVTNLNAERLDGNLESAFGRLADNESVTGDWSFNGSVTLGDAAADTLTINATTSWAATASATFNGTGAFNGSVTLGSDAADSLTINATTTWSALADATFNGSVTLGDAAADNLTVNATTTFTGNVALGNGTDTITINGGAGLASPAAYTFGGTLSQTLVGSISAVPTQAEVASIRNVLASLLTDLKAMNVIK